MNVVAVGGGHGLSRALSALRMLGLSPTAVVTVADDGGSSGRLRRDLGVIALGDLRMALLSLAGNDALAGVLGHRFERGELEGHALGNLLLLALTERHGGDVVPALTDAAALLACAGRVLPATAASVQLKASVAGRQVDGQVRVATAPGRIERIWLEPEEARACAEAVAAIADAEVVLLGPGSLFTSVLAALVVPGLGRALVDTSARVVYLANVLTQPGETTGLSAAAHLQALLDHVPGLRIDAVVLHDGPVPEGAGEPLGSDVGQALAAEVHRADVAARDEQGRVVAAHDPARLAAALRPVLLGAGAPTPGGSPP
jgi:uncharacterized cofD-like protein